MTYETINIDLRSKPDWFLQRNPLGFVPVLELDGEIICESDVCCDYLDEVYNENKLKPFDPDRQKRDKTLLDKFSNVTTPYYQALFSWGKDKRSVADFHSGLNMWESELKDRGGLYFGGDSFMMLDFMIYPHMERVAVIHKIVPEMELSREKYPLLYAWIRRMKELPAVKKTMFPDEVHVEFLKNFARGTQDYDMGL